MRFISESLGPGPLAGPQRQPAQVAQHPADGTLLGGQPDRRTHLTGDLLIAVRSKIVTGALLWLRPTTSTLTCSPPRIRRTQASRLDW
jgi:hypothetical protein